jgi:hypothetical protein
MNLIIIAVIMTAGMAGVFAMNSADAATVQTDKLDYPPGSTVIVTGSGWQPAETVSLLFHEEPMLNQDITQYVIADDSGDIYSEYTIEPEDAGVASIDFMRKAKRSADLRFNLKEIFQ